MYGKSISYSKNHYNTTCAATDTTCAVSKFMCAAHDATCVKGIEYKLLCAYSCFTEVTETLNK